MSLFVYFFFFYFDDIVSLTSNFLCFFHIASPVFCETESYFGVWMSTSANSRTALCLLALKICHCGKLSLEFPRIHFWNFILCQYKMKLLSLRCFIVRQNYRDDCYFLFLCFFFSVKILFLNLEMILGV